MRLVDAQIGLCVGLVEPMDDGAGTHEVRCTYYERRDGVANFSSKFVCAYRVRTIQGDPASERRARFDTGDHRTMTEVPALLPVVEYSETPWGHLIGASAHALRAELAELERMWGMG